MFGEFDAWGNSTSSGRTQTANYDALNINLFKYKSYCLDQDLGMYYLQSRYYYPVMHRFFNTDTPEMMLDYKDETAGTNLFAYCNNDPVNNSDPTGCYCRNDAISYAKRWYKTPNPKYHYYTHGDCANFVSQCLHAGGLRMNNNWYGKYVVRKGINIPTWTRSDSWAIVSTFSKYFINAKCSAGTFSIRTNSKNKAKNYLKTIINSSKLKIGDILLLDDTSDGCWNYTHATIITKIDSTDIYYTAHTNSRKDQSLYAKIKKGEVFGCYIIKIKNGAR